MVVTPKGVRGGVREGEGGRTRAEIAPTGRSLRERFSAVVRDDPRRAEVSDYDNAPETGSRRGFGRQAAISERCGQGTGRRATGNREGDRWDARFGNREPGDWGRWPSRTSCSLRC
ncbi:MAG TPA: hypothetical protein DCQ98_22650 [Planctomycetaceae bacterium]|nr:hypothetical protein [Planctomycetaceae bacterium]